MSADYGFGPLGAHATTVRPAVTPDNFAQQTWFKDATASGAKDGTRIDASWLNHIVGNIRYLCRMAGISFGNTQGSDNFLHDGIVALIKRHVGSSVVRKLISLDDVNGSIPLSNGFQLQLMNGKWTPFDPSTYLSAFATQTYVDGKVTALVGLSPTTLDTLGELASALGNDQNFFTNVYAALANRLIASNNLSDLANVAAARANLGLGGAALSNVSDFDPAGAAAAVLATARTEYVMQDGSTPFTARQSGVDGLLNADLATVGQMNAAITASINPNMLLRDGSVAATGNIPMGGFTLTGLGAATANGQPVRYDEFQPISTIASAALPSASYTAADVLAKFLTVDGAGSLADADLLDGQHGAYYLNAGNISAGTLPAARLPAFTGDATVPVGTSTITLANSGVAAGTYKMATVTVDAKGRVTSASQPAAVWGL